MEEQKFNSPSLNRVFTLLLELELELQQASFQDNVQEEAEALIYELKNNIKQFMMLEDFLKRKEMMILEYRRIIESTIKYKHIQVVMILSLVLIYKYEILGALFAIRILNLIIKRNMFLPTETEKIRNYIEWFSAQFKRCFIDSISIGGLPIFAALNQKRILIQQSKEECLDLFQIFEELCQQIHILQSYAANSLGTRVMVEVLDMAQKIKERIQSTHPQFFKISVKKLQETQIEEVDLLVEIGKIQTSCEKIAKYYKGNLLSMFIQYCITKLHNKTEVEMTKIFLDDTLLRQLFERLLAAEEAKTMKVEADFEE